MRGIVDEYEYLIDPEAAGDRIRKITQPDGTWIYKKYTGEYWKPDWDAYNKAIKEEN